MTIQSVDHHLLTRGVSRTFWHFEAGPKSEPNSVPDSNFCPETPRVILPAGPDRPAFHVGSLRTDGLHSPLFDYDWQDIHFGLWSAGRLLDVPRQELVAVSSTTNWHIYAPTVAMPWPDMVDMLQMAADPWEWRLINDGYRDLSIRDGLCCLRLPGIVKSGDGSQSANVSRKRKASAP